MLSIPIRIDSRETAAKPRLPRDFSVFFYRTVGAKRNWDIASDGRRAERVAKPAGRRGERLREEETECEARVEAKAERERSEECVGQESPQVILANVCKQTHELSLEPLESLESLESLEPFDSFISSSFRSFLDLCEFIESVISFPGFSS